MEVQFGPNSEDEPKLLYKLQRKLKVFKENPLPHRGYNLITCSSKYALVFVASPDGILSVYYLKDLIDKECESPPHLSLKIQESPTHISVNCDCEYLAVTGGQFLNIYNVANFQNQNIQPSVSIRCDVNPATFVSSLQWNPCIPDTIALAFFDGTLLISQVHTIQVKKIQTNARCICWSPKGKQLVVANSDGTLCQYKPDLTPAKTIPAPDLFKGASIETLAIHWIATYQFAVVYRNASGDDQPVVTIINTPKGGQPICLNYDDMCYSSGCNRPWYYYLIGVAQWNLILVSSSNSMEIATLGSTDGNNWAHWCQIDEARAELPLSDKKQESYPVGLCFDYSAIHQLPWGENEILPHMPLLHVISHSGLLTIFNVVNLKTASQICIPPQEIMLPAEGLITELPIDTVQDKHQQSPAMGPSILETLEIQGSQQIPANVLDGQPQTAVQTNATVKIPNFVVPTVETNATIKLPSFSKVQQSSTGPPLLLKPEIKTEEIKKEPSEHYLAQTNMQTSTQIPALKTQAPQNTSREFKANDLKLDQKKAAEALEQELKSMLIKEVNDFQMELYKFMQKMQECNVKVSQNLKLIESNLEFQSMSGEKLKQECYLEELRAAVVQLKRELVRSCAIVAEAHSHAGAKDLYMWNQADPLSNKKMESIKKLIYYIQSQLDQAHKALNYKWNEILYDPRSKKSVTHMIKPILENVYQPLVKQQEILSRQEAVLKTLRNTLNECDLSPMWKSKSMLRTTPFRNKDPLSKLTKNILNMSIDNRTTMNKPRLSPQKLDALKDMLANYKTVKIKPVNVELHQHLSMMKLSYDRDLKEKHPPEDEDKDIFPEIGNNVQKTIPSVPTTVALRNDYKENLMEKRTLEEEVHAEIGSNVKEIMLQRTNDPYAMRAIYENNFKGKFASEGQVYTEIGNNAKETVPQFITGSCPVIQGLIETKSEVTIHSAPIPQNLFPEPVADGCDLARVTRVLFTEVLDKEKEKQETTIQTLPQPASAFNTKVPITSAPLTINSQSVLKDLLKKNDASTFMGQKICSPTSNTAATINKTSTPTMFSGNQSVSGIFSQNGKFSTDQMAPPKIQPNVKSAETGEPEDFPKDSSVNQPLSFSMQASNENKTPSSINAFAIKPELKSNKPVFSIPGIKPLGTFQSNSQNTPDILKANSVKPLLSQLSNKNAIETKPLTNVSDLKFNQQIKAANESEHPIAGQIIKRDIDVKSVVATSETKQSMKIQPEKTSALPVTKLDILIKVPESLQVSAPSEVIETITTLSAETPTLACSTESSEVKLESPKISTEITSSAASTLFASANASAPKSPPAFGVNATSQGSIFGSGTATQASNIFATANAKTPLSISATFISPTVTSTPSSITTATSLTTSIFSTPVTSSQVLSNTPTLSSSVVQSQQLDASKVTSQPQTSDTPTTIQSPGFGSTTSSPVSPSVFTGAVPPSPLFGSQTSVMQPIVFGGQEAVNPQKSVSTTPTTSATPVFSNPISTSSSIFGNTTKTTQTSLFGTSTATTAVSIFGSTTTQASIFGTPSSTTTQSIFGTPTTTTTVEKSIFGSSPTTTQSSIFGSPASATTQSSIFGTPSPTTTSATSLFEMSESNLFAAANISTTSAPSQSSTGNIFGGGGSTSNVFRGTASNVFGGKTSFGQSNNAASIFSGQSSFGQQQQQQTNLWGGGNTTSTFGSGFSQSNQTPSVFGGGGAFSPSTGQAFGSPTPAGNQSPVFGTPQQSSISFGGSPVFGGKSAFGQNTNFVGTPGGGGGAGAFSSFGGFNKSPSSGFGAPATFGGVSAFGNTSPSKAFGGGSPGFGATTQSNATFESLATQNTLTFGNLAQQSAQQSTPAFSNSPAFTGWRG